MTMTEIKNVVVVGAGAMGSQIGLLCALAGYSRHHHRYRAGRAGSGGNRSCGNG